MEVTASKLIQTAREFLGVPYMNQGRTKAGTDCGGLLLMVGQRLGLTELEFLGYANSPDGETFERLLNENCDPVEPYDQPIIGDILAVDYGKGIQHTAFVVELEPRLKVIHAKRPKGDGRIKARGVVEHYFSGKDLAGWVKTFRIRGVINE